jgi:hypothetical protein
MCHKAFDAGHLWAEVGEEERDAGSDGRPAVPFSLRLHVAEKFKTVSHLVQFADPTKPRYVQRPKVATLGSLFPPRQAWVWRQQWTLRAADDESDDC